MWSNSTMPLLTTMPIRIRIPICYIMLNGVPVAADYSTAVVGGTSQFAWRKPSWNRAISTYI